MLLEAKNLEFSYEENQKIEFPDFELESGESLLILGKSGSGKTTLLNMLAGLLKPKSGEISIDGKDIIGFSQKQMDQFRGKHIGLIFQKPHLLAPLSVKENLEVVPFFGKTQGESPARILEELDIKNKVNSKVRTLSEGEAQRVSIARALMNKPKLILADEPTSSLDDENAERVIKLLKDQAQRIGAGLIIVTHDQRIKNHVSKFIEVKKNESV
ncbi:ABC transporter ATP-binding protein [Algoriphagus sediminis]|uniref:ABC transporter ATP-binding protein n=1 Tax=Algoriphagus sediminis TaxID=3057113 RepID=A0ABT7YG83_9BACT|nr:ABC transporter ATP-binding protein [Algoriphagus sediminis]MDN3205533.1 ABC transporter ATP-binding protein [Algoriphagus sediminis]